MTMTLILQAIEAAESLFGFAMNARAHLQQTGEWTPEQETEFQAKIAASKAKPHWQIQPEKKP